MNRSFQNTQFRLILASTLMLWCIAIGAATPALSETEKQSKRIKSGAPSYSHPNTGLLETDNYSCTATLVPGTRCVLTASHCSTGKSDHTFSVGDARFAVETFSSPKTGRNTKADIAIGRLSEAPAFEIEIAYDQPAPDFSLATPDHRVAPGTPLTVVGHGETGSFEQGKFGEQRSGDMTFSHYTERSAAGRRYRSTTLTLHPGVSDVSVCSGDSGGPVFEGDTLVGITSAGWQIERPSFLCVADAPEVAPARYLRRKVQSCSSKKQGKKASICLDETTNLQWSTVRSARQRLYLEHLMYSEHIPADRADSHGVAKRFCETLNSPEEHLKNLEKAGIQLSSRYKRSYLQFAQSGTNWRLPSISELSQLSDGQQTRSRKKDSLVLSTIRKHRTHLFWARDLSNDQPYRPVVHMGTGVVQFIGANATSCDRQTLGEAVSVAHYAEWISREMERLGCFDTN